jgi:vacuolar-type H+-ATPase subunit H
MSTRRDESAVERRGGDLGQLIEVEERLRDRLARARGEAERLVEESRREAERLADRGATDLEQALESLEQELEADLERERERIESEATVRVADLERLLAERGDALAAYVVNRVIGAAPAESRPASVEDDYRNVEGAGSRPAR